MNDPWRIVFDCIGLLFNGVNVAVLSSFVVVVVDDDEDEEDDEEKKALDIEGDIYSDNDCNIWLGLSTLADERPPVEFNGIVGVQRDDDDDDDVADDDNEIISLFRSTIGACFITVWIH